MKCSLKTIQFSSPVMKGTLCMALTQVLVKMDNGDQHHSHCVQMVTIHEETIIFVNKCYLNLTGLVVFLTPLTLCADGTSK